jgi:hypothetical protein
MEKLSPILAFYVEDGIERGAARCFEVLSYGGMGHTAGIHTRSREAAKRYGIEMPASRVIVNSPTTHGAIGFSTALPPSMTLGCGSWGGNVTSDNVSPLHLMDIKRVAFETRAVVANKKRPAPAVQKSEATTQVQATDTAMGGGEGRNVFSSETIARNISRENISREQIAAIVDRFLANRHRDATQASNTPAMNVTNSPAPAQPVVDVEAGSMYAAPAAAPHAEAAPTAQTMPPNGKNSNDLPRRTSPAVTSPPNASTNGHKAVDFVCEDDVRRAIQKGEKIYVNARTIITPAARDIGESAEVFAKG